MSTIIIRPSSTPAVPAPPTGAERAQEQWGLARLIVMHLLPGLIILGGYAGVAWLMRGWDVPHILPLVVAIPFTMIPVELGYLLYQGKRTAGRYTLRGVIGYNQPLSIKEYAIWIPATMLASIAIFMLFGVIDGVLFQRLFFWWPVWLNPDYGSLAGLEPSMFWISVGLLMLFGNWIGPAVEELYFRGYLLPRMEHLGGWGVVLNSVLFAMYHFWSPWYVISRAFGALPFGFAARWKRNAIIPLVVHCALNTVGTLLALAAIL